MGVASVVVGGVLNLITQCYTDAGEHLSPGSGIKDAVILQADEAVVITAEEEFDDVLPDGQ